MTGDNTNTRKKASAVFFAAIMVVSMVGVGFAGSAAAVTGASGGADATGAVQEAPVSPTSIDEGQQTTVTFAATFTGQTGDSNTDTVNLTFPDEFAGELSPNSESAEFAVNDTEINASSSISVVDGPDQDGNQDTVQAQYDPSSDGDVEVEFDVDVTAPSVTDTTTFNPEFSYADSDDTTASTSLDLEVANTDSSVADGPVVNTDTGEQFADITTALNDANTDAGDTIEVDAADGPYEEQVTVNKDVTLQSVNGQATITAQTTGGLPTVKIVNDGVEIYGFEIVSQGEDGSSLFAQSLQTEDASDIIVENNLLSATNLSADDNGTRQGGLLVQAASADVSNITIEDNVIDGSGQGIYTDANDQEITELTVEGNDVSNILADAEFALGVRSSGSIGTVNGEATTNAQISAVLNDNSGIDTTNPYAVEVTPTDVTVGDSAQVEADILGRDDADPRVQDVPYEVQNTSSDPVASGSTSSNSFSTLVEFTEVGDYSVDLTDEGTEATISSQYTIEGFEVSPSSPGFGDSVQLSGQIVDGQGDGVDVGTIELVNVNDSSTGASASTTSSGNFSFTGDVDDAATFGVGTGTDSVFAEFDVAADDASLTLESDSTPQFNEESTFTAQVNDSAGDPIVGSNTNGYLNVSGPFDEAAGVSGDTKMEGTASDGEIPYVHVNIDDSGSASLTATPVGEDVSVSLENEVGDELVAGLEDTTTATGAVPDYVADSQSVAVEQLNELNVETAGGDSLNVDNNDATDGNTLDVTVTGSDGQGPGNNLANATVNVTAQSVDAGAFYDGTTTTSGDGSVNVAGGDTFEFSDLSFEEAGTATVTVTAQNSSGDEFTTTEEFDITGDNLANVTPTDVNVQENDDVTVEVTNSDGTAVNNRVVALTNVTFGVNTSSGVQTFDRVVIDGSNGAIYADTDGSGDYTSNGAVDDAIVVNDGTYVAENVSFESTGSVDVDVYRPGNVDLSAATKTIDVSPISVSGVEAYEVQSDVDPTLAGANDQINLTVTEDGQEVNGSLLNDISNNVAVTQNGTDIVTTGASAADLDDDGTVDTIQVTISAENADEQVDIEVDDGNDRTGATTIDVVAPSVTAAVNDREGDALTEGLNATVDYTVEDPRDGSAFDSGTLTVEAVNATFQVDENMDGSFTEVADGDDYDISLDADGQATVTIGVQEFADDANSPELLHNAQADGASTAAGDVALPAGSPSIYLLENGERADVPDNVEPDSSVDYTFEVTDANNRNLPLDGVTFEADGAGLDVSTPLDEGFVSVSGDVTSGTIDLNINDVEQLNLDSIEALDSVDLNLTADAESVTQNESIEFALTRSDFSSETTGQLNITNASGASVETVSIDGTETVTFDTATYEPGNYTVEATKDSTSSTAFNADTVNVTVEEEPSSEIDVNVTDVNPAEPNTSATYNADVTFTNVENETAQFVSVDFGEQDVNLSNVDADSLGVNQPDGSNLDIANLYPGDSTEGLDNSTLVIELGDTIADANENDTYTVSVPDVDNGDAGDYTLTIGLHESGDEILGAAAPAFAADSDEYTIGEVEEPAFFEVSELDAPANASQGDTVNVSALVTNTGDLTAEQTVEFRVDGDEVANETVELNGSANTTVEFTLETSDIEPGTYTHGVYTDDDNATAELTIEEVEGPGVITEDGEPAQDLDGDGVYEDVDGNGELDIFDVQALFDNRDDIASENVEFFDFDDNGEVDIFDVQQLFDQQQDA